MSLTYRGIHKRGAGFRERTVNKFGHVAFEVPEKVGSKKIKIQ